MRAYVIFIIFILHLSGCKPKQITIDFIYDGMGYIYVPITVQDSTINFVFDTGSTGSFIDSGYINEASINPEDTILGSIPHLQAGYTRYYGTYPKGFNIGGISAPQKICFATGKLFEHKAVAGTDMIDQFCWRFNFKTRKMTISKQSIKIDSLTEKWLKIPYKLQNGLLKIHTYLNDSVDIGEFYFDTGARKHLSHGGKIILGCMATHDSIIVNQLIGKLQDAGFTKYFDEKEKINSWFFGYDSIKMFGYTSLNCWIQVVCNENIKGSYRCGLTLTYAVEQFSEMYIDSRKKILYLKP